MSSTEGVPELKAVPELVSRIIELFDPERIISIDINELISSIADFVFRIRKIRIEDFELSRAESSIPAYLPGVFPKGFMPIKTLKDLTTVTPIIVYANFVITQRDASKIKARGLGELSVYISGKKVIVQARNLWQIEEVMEIEPRESEEAEEKRVEKLEKFIREILIAFIATLLAELATKALIGI
jgi:hypothetical protein